MNTYLIPLPPSPGIEGGNLLTVINTVLAPPSRGRGWGEVNPKCKGEEARKYMEGLGEIKTKPSYIA
jgi:hypothetical protein